jgi:hypothetical protein
VPWHDALRALHLEQETRVGVGDLRQAFHDAGDGDVDALPPEGQLIGKAQLRAPGGMAEAAQDPGGEHDGRA